MYKSTRIISLLLLHILVSGCASGPIDYPRNYSEVIIDTRNTTLGRAVSEWHIEHPGVSGFYPIISGTLMILRSC